MSNIVPPIKVKLVAFSPNISQTQMGPKSTSDNDKSVSSAAGTVFEPAVYKISPKPTWKTPNPNATAASNPSNNKSRPW